MPASVVRPDESDKAVDELVRGLPLPPGFDRSALGTGAAARDRYQLGFQVVAAVACGWFDRWVNGDATARKEAVAAMQTAREWPVLKQMERDGAYGEVLLQYVDAMAADGKIVGGKPLSVEESYEGALGC
jgi:hypothetical protein